MVNLLNEVWERDGVAAVFRRRSEDFEYEDGENNDGICDLDHGCWENEHLDIDDICAFADLIAAAPDMYRMLHSIVDSKKASIKDIKALLNSIRKF